MAETMTPGRELDALVAEKVMGWTDVRDHGPDDDGKPFWKGVPSSEAHLSAYDRANYRCYGDAHLPRYSTAISAAWLVVERVCDGLGYDLGMKFGGNPSDGWWAQVYDTSPGGYVGKDGQDISEFSGYETDWERTLPLAICRAALDTVSILSVLPHDSKETR